MRVPDRVLATHASRQRRICQELPPQLEQAFRKLRLYPKAIEALHIALEIDPRSLEIRQKLRELLELHNFALSGYLKSKPLEFQPIFDHAMKVAEQLKPMLADGRVLATIDQYGARPAVFGIDTALKAIKDKKSQKDLAPVVETTVTLITK